MRVCKNIRVFTLGVAKQGVQQVIKLSVLIGLSLWISEVFLYTQPGKARIFPPPLTILLINSLAAKFIGVVLIVIGQIVFTLALIAFSDSWRVGIGQQMPGTLVTTGIFAITRNPIFVFVDLYFVGTFLINGTAIFLIFAVLIVIGLHYQILQEEKLLFLTYGIIYQNYYRRTGRYFGRRSQQKVLGSSKYFYQ
ncbi:MAG: isoprenylcysteine carboxylmethyltransferase family protein [Anaerolineae bacterium]|nr:isoprenylcysteine carboxylmethyltransferase family protein [Anaerolineae bacterium]